jgi:hypothetical protein
VGREEAHLNGCEPLQERHALQREARLAREAVPHDDEESLHRRDGAERCRVEGLDRARDEVREQRVVAREELLLDEWPSRLIDAPSPPHTRCILRE